MCSFNLLEPLREQASGALTQWVEVPEAPGWARKGAKDTSMWSRLTQSLASVLTSLP